MRLIWFLQTGFIWAIWIPYISLLHSCKSDEPMGPIWALNIPVIKVGAIIKIYRNQMVFGNRIHMKSSSPKRVKRQYQKQVCNANTKFDYYILEKRFSQMNKCVYMHIFMKSYFPKHDLQTWHCHCNLDVLEKSSSHGLWYGHPYMTGVPKISLISQRCTS